MKPAVAIFLFLGVLFIPSYLYLSNESIDLFGNSAQLIGLVFAAYGFLQASEHAKEKDLRSAFFRIAAGMGIWAIGQIMVSYSELVLHRSPYGTVSSSFFVIGNVLLLQAILSLVRLSAANVPKLAIRRYLISAFLLGLILVPVVIVFIRQAGPSSEGGVTQKILDYLYPLFDVAEMMASLVLVRIAVDTKQPNLIKSYGFFLASFSILLVGDLITVGSGFKTFLYRAVDMLYFCSYFFIAMAGICLARHTVVAPLEKKYDSV